MNFITRAATFLGLGPFRGESRTFVGGTAANEMHFVTGSRADAGIGVTPDVALTHSAVWACVTAIADAIATLPVHVLRQKDGTKASDHAVHDVLHSSPNEYMTPAVFRSALMTNALLYGRGIAVVERDDMGRPTGLYPVPTPDVRVQRQGTNLSYTVRVGTVKAVTLRPDQVFDLLWHSTDGVSALGPIQYARHTVGLGLAVNKYAGKFFGNGGNIGGIINTGSLKEDAVKLFLKSFKDKYVGGDNAWKLAALPGDMKFEPMGTSPENGQMLETRAAQVVEVCRIFNVPPSRVHDLSRATWANIEHQQIQWAQSTLLPWTVRFEQEADRKLLLERERRRLEVRFNLDAVLRADTKTRYDAHRTGIEAGIITRNEARKMENLPPLPGGDVLLRPANTMTDAGDAATTGATDETPATDPPPADGATRGTTETRQHEDDHEQDQ